MNGDARELGDSASVPLGSALERLLAMRGLAPAAVFARISEEWEAAVGPESARHMRPRTLRERELVVEVDHPSWAAQVQISASEVLGRLRQNLGDEAPERISVLVVSEFPRKPL